MDAPSAIAVAQHTLLACGLILAIGVTTMGLLATLLLFVSRSL